MSKSENEISQISSLATIIRLRIGLENFEPSLIYTHSHSQDYPIAFAGLCLFSFFLKFFLFVRNWAYAVAHQSKLTELVFVGPLDQLGNPISQT